MFKSKKLIIIALLAVVGIGSAGMLVVKPRLAGDHKADKAEPQEPPHNLVLEDFTVNLADVERPRYLKTTVALAFEEESEIEEAKHAEPQIRDAVIMTLTRQYFRELLTFPGKQRLRDELETAINARLKPLGLEAKEVVFTAFVME